jgi:hypothetical protein
MIVLSVVILYFSLSFLVVVSISIISNVLSVYSCVYYIGSSLYLLLLLSLYTLYLYVHTIDIHTGVRTSCW